MILGNPLTTVIDYTATDPTGVAPSTAERTIAGSEIVAQTSRTMVFTRKDHQKIVDELEREERERLAAERAAEAARVRHIFDAAVQRRAQRIAEAEARLRQARFGNQFST
jgi:flagellar biosynthesis/type III secretory pathway chaperone